VSQPPVIACVEDDASVREALEGFLRSSGYRTECFSSAEDFLRSGALERIACLVTDVHLGGMSGLQLLEQLQVSDRPVPAIVITAYSENGTPERSKKAGAIAFFLKPIIADDLLTVVRKIFDSHDK
jgi:FixJ family two-component response regulator